MKKKLLSLALALVMCLGLTVPAFAAETKTYTYEGLTITVSSDGTLSYTGSGAFTDAHMEAGFVYLANIGGLDGKTVSISIGPDITNVPDESVFVKLLGQYGASVTVNRGGQTVQGVGGFTDVKPGDYFADPVVWAVGRKITSGTTTTTFSPGTKCTVAQILTFLWRAKGSPSSSKSNPFSDVKSSDYYYNAALWAYEKGMVSGGTFDGARPCTRSMAVTYLWKAAGSPSDATADFEIGEGYLARYTGDSSDVVIPNNVTFIGMDWFQGSGSLTSVTIPSSVTSIEMSAFDDCDSLTDVYYEGSEAQWQAIKVEAPVTNDGLSKATIHYNCKMPEQSVQTGFTDVPANADYAAAVAWAVEKGVTGGTSATTFSPDNVCTRGQIVTFLYRAMAK